MKKKDRRELINTLYLVLLEYLSEQTKKKKKKKNTLNFWRNATWRHAAVAT